MNDVLQEVDIAMTGYAFKKAAAFGGATIRNLMSGEDVGRMIADGREIKDDTVKLGVWEELETTLRAPVVERPMLSLFDLSAASPAAVSFAWSCALSVAYQSV